MKKLNLLLIGLLLMSIVAMSGCTGSKTSDTTAPTEENAGNVSPNNTMPPGNPGQMPPNNSTMPPGGNPGQMPSNYMPPGGAPPAGSPGNMS